MNKFQFLGRLTKDPETRAIANSDTQVATFSVAVNRRFADKSGERQTDFFNLTAFGKTAEFCSKYFRKGQQVLVEGRIQNRTWEDQNGQKRYMTDFIIENAYFADSKREGNYGSDSTPAPSSDGEFITLDETEELPF